MRILVAASEAAPLAKTGGLGDVVGALPSALRELGCEVSLVIPAYRKALENTEAPAVLAKALPVKLGRKQVSADILETEINPGISLYMVRRDEFFDRSGIYGTSDGEYFDSRERFIFFSRSIPLLCRSLDYHPDVIMANDWQTGLLMALLDEGAIPGAAGVFTIHNLGYQGLVAPEQISLIGLPEKYYGIEGLEFYGQMSLLKAGIVCAHAVTTVSPTYAQEIQTSEFGFGLDGLLRSIKDRLFGILNGIDEEAWDPEKDIHLQARYSRDDLSGKEICKRGLLKEVGLPLRLMKRPLLGMVSRLVSQKGCELLLDTAEKIFGLDVGVVLLGSGEVAYEKAFSALEEKNQSNFRFIRGFDEPLAHRIYGGSDCILVPSLYEPCGLAQMYGLRYGSIPVVRATGGLNDTVQDPRERRFPGTGFKFEEFDPAAFLAVVERANTVYKDNSYWQAMMREGMAQDFSWRRSAEEYLKVFEKAIRSKRGEDK
ncbi:MAG TPA: glycogen synthase GlgA [Desulfobacteraceae bacterium]|nr:glycogen synthase GlgA [Desulfobacteraceae bacterium]